MVQNAANLKTNLSKFLFGYQHELDHLNNLKEGKTTFAVKKCFLACKGLHENYKSIKSS